MPAALDTVIDQLKAAAAAQARQLPKPRRPAGRIDDAEQLTRFLSGAERHRLDSGQVTPTEWAQYQSAMLDKLAAAGALEVPHVK